MPDTPEQVSGSEWETLRGFNIHPQTENAVLDTIIENTGANLIRLSLTNTGRLMSKTPPYEFNEGAFQDLNRILDWAETREVRVLIDPHTTPGTRSDYTIYPDDELWQDKTLQEHLIRLWVRIANEQKHRGKVIAGYDLLNEPSTPDISKCGDPWNELIAVLVDTIRATGSSHPIIIEPAGRKIGGECDGSGGRYIDRKAGLKDLILPNDENIVVSPHFYEPTEFAFQGVEGNPLGYSYPGLVGETRWDRDQISRSLQPIRDFQIANPDVPVLIGEFSASRGAGPDGDVYLRDLIELIEAEGWSWAYHDFRGYVAWDPERPYTSGPPFSIEAVTRSWDNLRMDLLREYYIKNGQAR
ncbi:MAG: cellulase family glycosylhydrolase [Balneolales bacterium]